MMKTFITGTALLMVSTQVWADASYDRAIGLLKKATDRLESAQSISVNAVATLDEIEPVDEFKIKKTFRMEVRFKRPDKIFATKSGDENQRAYFDGKSLTVIEPVQKKYAQENLAGDIDDLVAKLGSLNIEAPLADLFLSDLSELALKSVQKARYIGTSRIAGRNCEHIAVRTPLADWQLWLSQGDNTFICKSVITTRSLSQAPEYEVTFGEWKFNTEIADSMFVAQIPEGASLVPFAPGTFRSTF
ncbi:MAG TPA: DUF2092 domain-containing protein [Oligoflexus sp.]|uniref:DUF2092 domain-containing protein n=1 Tax=Oligoflexus sp. TaxID=1971216 RepID=UPI002D80BE10|nr:DUF2092 domain-containing protein [Oligoflexus sp.]HET9238079.1 DUF2092 domain-containing protein [Oligoflexus sp.]